MRLFIRFAPKVKCSTNDLVTQSTRTLKHIKATSSMCMLPMLESKVYQIADYYCSVREMPYWVNKMHGALLVKRCELLTIQYPENEEA